MPMLIINTNVTRDAIPETFLADMTSVVAKEFSKPEGYVVVQVNPDMMMTFGGTKDPCAFCYMSSIGGISNDANKKHSKAIMDKLTKELAIKPDRMYINFEDMPRGNVGYNGGTFA